MSFSPHVGHIGHQWLRCRHHHLFDIRDHIATAYQLYERPYTDLVFLDKRGIETSGVFNSYPTNIDWFNADTGFQVAIFARGPDDVHHLGLDHLVAYHHLERKRVLRILVFAHFIQLIMRHNNTIGFVFILASEVHKLIRKLRISKFFHLFIFNNIGICQF